MNKYYVTTALVLLLGACNSAPSTPQTAKRSAPAPQKSEVLLAREAGVMTVEEDQKPLDPRAAHLWARRQVDPNELTTEHAYTSKTTPEEMEKANYHVMRLQPGTVAQPAPPEQFSVSAREEAFESPPPLPKAKPDAPVDVVVASQVPTPLEKPSFKPVRGLNANAPAAIRAVEENSALSIEPHAGSDNHVVGVRVGDHPGKTRIVFDVEDPADYSIDIQNNGTALAVQFKGAEWGANPEKSFGAHGLLSGYEAHNIEGGSDIVMALKKPVKVVSQISYPPNETYENHRIVIDISGL